MSQQRKPTKKIQAKSIQSSWGSWRPDQVVALWKSMMKSYNTSSHEANDIGTIYVKRSGDISVEFSSGKRVSLKEKSSSEKLVGIIFAEAAKALLAREK